MNCRGAKVAKGFLERRNYFPLRSLYIWAFNAVCNGVLASLCRFTAIARSLSARHAVFPLANIAENIVLL